MNISMANWVWPFFYDFLGFRRLLANLSHFTFSFFRFGGFMRLGESFPLPPCQDMVDITWRALKADSLQRGAKNCNRKKRIINYQQMYTNSFGPYHPAHRLGSERAHVCNREAYLLKSLSKSIHWYGTTPRGQNRFSQTAFLSVLRRNFLWDLKQSKRSNVIWVLMHFSLEIFIYA